MYIIKPYQTAVTLFSRDGDFRVFSCIEHAYRQLGDRFIGRKVGPDFRVFLHESHTWSERDGEMVCRTEPVYLEFGFILRDDAGKALTLSDFAHLRQPSWMRWNFALRTWNGKGPVPNIGRLRGGHYFRHPGTMAERRQAQVMDEFDVAPRAARNERNLPTAYDDFHVAAREDRSWKRHRKTRWKAA